MSDSRRRAIIGIKKIGGRLPSAYQEVEYIESTGKQYIDTGVYSKILEIKYSATSGAHGWIYYSDTYNSRTSLFCDRINYGRYATGADFFTIGINTIKLTSDKFYLNNIEITTLPTIDYNVSWHFYLFARHETRTGYSPIDQWVTGKLYYCKLYDNNSNLVRNFIPCYRILDNKPGLYDLVNDVFYTNANTSASQDFIVGPDVN